MPSAAFGHRWPSSRNTMDKNIVWIPIIEGYPKNPSQLWTPSLRRNMEKRRDVYFVDEPPERAVRVDGWQQKIEKLLRL